VVTEQSSSYHEFLLQSDPKSAMYKVYYDMMDGNSDAYVDNIGHAKDVMLNREKTLYYSSSYSVVDDDRGEEIG
jgi:hypothetical protein